MEWLLITLKIYRRVFTRAAQLAVKNWAVLATAFVYYAIMTVSFSIAVFLGILGGFLVALVRAACIGSFLYLVEAIVCTRKVTLEDFSRSFGEYLWDVVGVYFLSWIFFSLATPAILQLPNGNLILLFIEIAIFVVFNAVPELIYLGHYSSMALLSESYAFIAANWIEWFPANIAAAALLYSTMALPVTGVGAYAQEALLALLLYFAMIMRGLLFTELHNSTHRSRAFKYRMEG